MRAESPRPFLRYRLGTNLVLLDPVKKRSRQLSFAGIAFPMDRAQVKKLVAQCILLFLLGKHSLQRQSQFAQPRSLGPGLIVRLAAQMLVAGKQPSPATRALFQASKKLLAKSASQHLQLINFHFAARVHYFPCLPCIAASTSSAVCGSAATRSISLPSAPTRNTHSMRTPSFSRSEEHTSELQSLRHLVCRLLL